jgi:putative MATE family efflux protein
MNTKNQLTQGPVAKTLTALTVPMIFGMLSMVTFNLVDTFFVSRLGTKELAAMGFTFPVVMFVVSIALGLGVGTASVVSRAIGRGDHHQVQRLTTDSLIIALFTVIIFAVLGLLSMDWVFKLLGADAGVLPLVKQYMRIWYIGVAFVVIPMVGNNAIRACGNTLYPALIMVFSTIINVILDPLLIFGLGFFPRLELTGAAIATVIARAVAMVLSLLTLHFKEKLLDFALPALEELKDSLRQIFYIGIPSAASRLLIPLTMAVIMRLVAEFGPPAVAAFGVAIKIEMFVFMVIMALATALIPFVGQNWGAKNFERIREAVKGANKFSMWWGGANFLVFLILAVPLGYLFSKDPAVSKNITYYLWIIPISYGLRSIAFLIASAFNAINKPFVATGLNLVRAFVFYIPFAYVGSRLGGLVGLFIGLSVANLGAGLFAYSIMATSPLGVCLKEGRLGS